MLSIGGLMNLRIKSIYPYAGLYYAVDIFGYASHGVPGLEIVGMGKNGRAIKEKFIFLSRALNLKIPKRRFVICLEESLDGKKFKEDEYRYLELPMLILFWTLAGQLPFQTLEDCFCSGKIGINLEVDCLKLNQALQYQLKDILLLDEDMDLKYISSDHDEIIDEHFHISIEGVMASLSEISRT